MRSFERAGSKSEEKTKNACHDTFCERSRVGAAARAGQAACGQEKVKRGQERRLHLRVLEGRKKKNKEGRGPRYFFIMGSRSKPLPWVGGLWPPSPPLLQQRFGIANGHR